MIYGNINRKTTKTVTVTEFNSLCNYWRGLTGLAGCKQLRLPVTLASKFMGSWMWMMSLRVKD